METVHLGTIDYTILIVYTIFVLGIGFTLKRFMKSSNDFFLSGRSIPAWITGLAFISATLSGRASSSRLSRCLHVNCRSSVEHVSS